MYDVMFICLFLDVHIFQIGTVGQAVVPVINRAVQNWAGRRNRTVHYIRKGMNCLTEMYSAVQAEVPLPSDPQTMPNKSFLRHIIDADRVR